MMVGRCRRCRRSTAAAAVAAAALLLPLPAPALGCWAATQGDERPPTHARTPLAAPILASMWVSLDQGLELFEQCRYLSGEPLPASAAGAWAVLHCTALHVYPQAASPAGWLPLTAPLAVPPAQPSRHALSRALGSTDHCE